MLFVHFDLLRLPKTFVMDYTEFLLGLRTAGCEPQQAGKQETKQARYPDLNINMYECEHKA